MTVSLPKYGELSDSELMSWTSREFAERLIDKAKQFGQYVLSKDNYEVEIFEPEDRRQRMAEWNQRHAWLEWWLGVVPPSKQLVVLPDTEIGLKVRIAQQVVDEVKHQRIFSQHAKRYGGNPRFESLKAPATLQEMYRTTVAFDHPLDIAASLQVTGEAVLLGYVEPEGSITVIIVDQIIRDEIVKEILPEEIRHVNNGRDVISMMADTPQKRRRCCQIQDEKLHTLLAHYTVDHALLGAHRIGADPVI